ncbi:hypothetical protein DEU56DRAFT_751561 [Suillus clintonianus]|uniref:uncharacterized protein n=1 Tax=Suillus clintonianus TaxID=1904413 RepID=UPI001B865238|nr:uncharacterized protein DEU56DRAFT_751561 [Suillus clintonianus]KAG2153864.1 hypothetical protein DEU56DRAFT_751561 [Suillus clintonianus]
MHILRILALQSPLGSNSMPVIIAWSNLGGYHDNTTDSQLAPKFLRIIQTAVLFTKLGLRQLQEPGTRFGNLFGELRIIIIPAGFPCSWLSPLALRQRPWWLGRIFESTASELSINAVLTLCARRFERKWTGHLSSYVREDPPVWAVRLLLVVRLLANNFLSNFKGDWNTGAHRNGAVWCCLTQPDDRDVTGYTFRPVPSHSKIRQMLKPSCTPLAVFVVPFGDWNVLDTVLLGQDSDWPYQSTKTDISKVRVASPSSVRCIQNLHFAERSGSSSQFPIRYGQFSGCFSLDKLIGASLSEELLFAGAGPAGSPGLSSHTRRRLIILFKPTCLQGHVISD